MSLTRRHLLRGAGGTLAALALGWTPALRGTLHAGEPASPLAPRAPHFTPRAKRLVMIYLTGGFSHVDCFDPKPKLIADAGKEYKRRSWRTKSDTQYLKPPAWKFIRPAACGTEVGEIFPQLAACMDDICLIRSMKTDHGNHFEATLAMHTGSVSVPMPSLGSWLTYGLGSENRDLPGYVVFCKDLPYAGAQVWDASFLPGVHQGTRIIPGGEPIPNLRPRGDAARQRLELDLLGTLGAEHLATRGDDDRLRARLASFETAAGMQREAPQVFDLSGETAATRALYGKVEERRSLAWQCLVARRMLEAGVRTVEIVHTGSNSNWDSHGNMDDHARLAKEIDQPVAGLLRDLKSRGMLKDTLVVFATEFGRTPFVDTAGHKGREHHAPAFSCWLAGGGVKGGHVHGSTDDYGVEVAEGLVHLHDFHATILHLMGLDHERLTYRYAGRDFRLTDVHGHVVKEIVA